MFEAYGHDLRESVRCRTQMRETRLFLQTLLTKLLMRPLNERPGEAG